LRAFLLRIALALEHVARAIMHRFGVEERAQNVAIMVVAIFLVLTAIDYRRSDRHSDHCFLMLLMIHVLWPDCPDWFAKRPLRQSFERSSASSGPYHAFYSHLGVKTMNLFDQ